MRQSTGEDTTHHDDGNNGVGEAAGEWAAGGGVVFHGDAGMLGGAGRLLRAATVLATGMTGGHLVSGNVAGIHKEPPSTRISVKVILVDCLSLPGPHMAARSWGSEALCSNPGSVSSSQSGCKQI